MKERPVRIDRVVSSRDELLIVVDELDREIGSMTKARCHEGDGVLHRAFSLLLFNTAGEMLLQQRSATKELWPLHWSNSCCSHPRHGESMGHAIHRRLDEELGLRTELSFLFKFRYQARYEDVGSEHEVCSVYFGVSDEPPSPNRHEIAESRWLSPVEIDEELRAEPARFTPWFAMEWRRLRAGHAELFDNRVGVDYS
ncbi:MAG: isopentenyl-diphosphate Delta-isomerase [Acidobacteriota bacterium]|nr:MAG: isopentenyl-diphosphate Delta-isomerase [Acidobacteriota bacterium]